MIRLYQYPKLILLALITIVALLLTQSSKLHLDASADSLVLEGDNALQIYRDVNKKYGSEDFLVVTFAPKQALFSDSVLNEIKKLKTELLTLPEVSGVITILDVPLLYSPPVKVSELPDGVRYLSSKDTDRALAKTEFQNSPLYSQLLTSQNFDTTAIQINLKRDDIFFKLLTVREDLRSKLSSGELNSNERKALQQAETAFSHYSVELNNKQEKLIENVRLIIDKHREGGVLFLGGVPMIASDMIAFIKNDLLVFGAGLFLFIVILLAVIFRQIAWVLLPLFTCLITVLGMLGALAALDWKLTVISSNFVALLMIITLSITIHLAVRYRELSEAYTNESPRELVIDTVRFMLRPCLYTAITTIVAFASLVVSGIRPVIDFGWMMTFGVSAAFVVAFLVIPAGLMLIPLRFTRSQAVVLHENTAFTDYFARFADHHAYWVWGVSALLLVASIIGVSQLQVENRFIDYFDSSTEIYQGMEVIDQKLGGTIPLDIIIRSKSYKNDNKNSLQEGKTNVISGSEGDFEEISFDVFDSDFDDAFTDESSVASSGYWFTNHGLKEIEKLHNYVNEIEQTGKVLSLASLYQVLKDVTGSGIDDFQLALISQNLPDEIKGALIHPYLSEDGNESRLSVRVKETSYKLNRNELLQQIEHYLQDEMGLSENEYELTGMLVLYNNMLQSLFRSQILTLGAVFIAITLMFTLLFRSLYLALIAITPNLLAAGMVLGSMGLLGIPLDMMTITVAAITVGIGVDDTIHYIHRFKKEFAIDGDYVATMYRCHSSIGRAMFYTSVIIIMGFSILSLSNFTPTIYFGLLTGFAMFSALLGALVLLPRLIITLKPLGN